MRLALVQVEVRTARSHWFVLTCRSPDSAEETLATAAHTEPVSQFPIILSVEDRDIGIFAGLKTSLSRLQMKRARAVVGGGGDGLGW